MTRSNLSGFALSLVAALLAACGGSQLPGAMPQSPSVSRNLVSMQTQGRETVLYGFLGGSDGWGPAAGLIEDSQGDFFGTTAYGGVSLCEFGCGTVFEIARSTQGYVKRTLYRFHGSDGYWTFGNLLRSKNGSLFGVAWSGGGGACSCGLVFELVRSNSNYVEHILYTFSGGSDGNSPWAGLIADRTGNLYGTTVFGGGNGCGGWGCGTVFMLRRVAHGYAESVLHAFLGGQDGAEPEADLTRLQDGSLVGTTQAGGNARCGGGPSGGCGVVFRLQHDASGYKERIVHVFAGKHDGATPASSLVSDAEGNLYGTTLDGGRGCSEPASKGCGTVFKLSRGQGGYSETILYRFHGGRSDGEHPTAPPAIGENGVFFGSTAAGGNPYCRATNTGCGTIYKLTPAGSTYVESIIHKFDGRNGWSPNLLTGPVRNVLYGTTLQGGNSSCLTTGCGLVFALRS